MLLGFIVIDTVFTLCGVGAFLHAEPLELSTWALTELIFTA
jgi:hypothetical protein